MNEHIIVTGASGFIGSHLALELERRGYSVTAQYRRAEPPPALRELERAGGRLVRADLGSEDGAASLFAPDAGAGHAGAGHVGAPDAGAGNAGAGHVGALDAGGAADLGDSGSAVRQHGPGGAHNGPGLAGTGVIHVAALASDWGPYRRFHEANVLATERLLEAARSAGVRRVVHTSSLAVHGFGPHRGSTEQGPYYEYVNHYQHSKMVSEHRALLNNCEDFEVTVIRPGNVYGPGDTTTMFPIFDGIERGMMGFINAGRSLTSLVYIDDLVGGLINAYEAPGAAGRVYNLTSEEEVTWRRLVERAADLLGAKRPRLSLASGLAGTLAAAMEGTFRVFHAPTAPALTRYRVDQLAHDYHFDVTRARSELGFEPKTDFETGLARTVADYKKRT
jgi:nucleoside-diphosphate-sugar epimerase